MCVAIGTTISQLSSCCHQSEICECQDDPLEQERDCSCMLPDQGCMPDIQRFPAGSTAERAELHLHCVAERCDAEVKPLL